MNDRLAVTSDWFRELLTPRWLPKRVQNGSIHRSILRPGRPFLHSTISHALSLKCTFCRAPRALTHNDGFPPTQARSQLGGHVVLRSAPCAPVSSNPAFRVPREVVCLSIQLYAPSVGRKRKSGFFAAEFWQPSINRLVCIADSFLQIAFQDLALPPSR